MFLVPLFVAVFIECTIKFAEGAAMAPGHKMVQESVRNTSGDLKLVLGRKFIESTDIQSQEKKMTKFKKHCGVG